MSSEELRQEMRATWPEVPRMTTLAIAGAGWLGEIVLESCRRHGITVTSVHDGNPKLIGTDFHGMTVQPNEAVQADVPVIVCTHRLGLLQRHLSKAGWQRAIPFPVLAELAPDRFAAHPFYAGNLDTLATAASGVSQLFADARSREVFDAICRYRNTFDIDIIRPWVEGLPYLAEGVVSPQTNMVYVDGGAFDGDSLNDLQSWTNDRFAKAISFEPDEFNFRLLTERWQGDSRIHLRQQGLYSHAAELGFAAEGRQDSAIADASENRISLVALDDVPEAADASFIKLNIEGAEPDALRGAESLIRRQHPVLAVAVYHRPEHLFTLPRQILDIRSDYSLYLRQHDEGTVETVVYAIPTPNESC